MQDLCFAKIKEMEKAVDISAKFMGKTGRSFWKTMRF